LILTPYMNNPGPASLSNPSTSSSGHSALNDALIANLELLHLYTSHPLDVQPIQSPVTTGALCNQIHAQCSQLLDNCLNLDNVPDTSTCSLLEDQAFSNVILYFSGTTNYHTVTTECDRDCITSQYRTCFSISHSVFYGIIVYTVLKLWCNLRKFRTSFFLEETLRITDIISQFREEWIGNSFPTVRDLAYIDGHYNPSFSFDLDTFQGIVIHAVPQHLNNC
jgi:hypothetical protein